MINDVALEARARRVAKGAGYIAGKSRWRRGTVDNHGGFTIINPYRNSIVAAPRFEFTAQDNFDFGQRSPIP